MKKLIIFESILIIFFILSWNVSKAEGNIYGIGMWDCGKVVAEHSSGDWEEIVIDNYIQGYITASLIENDKVANFSGSAITSETINYCRQNPLKQLWEASMITYYKIIR